MPQGGGRGVPFGNRHRGRGRHPLGGICGRQPRADASAGGAGSDLAGLIVVQGLASSGMPAAVNSFAQSSTRYAWLRTMTTTTIEHKSRIINNPSTTMQLMTMPP